MTRINKGLWWAVVALVLVIALGQLLLVQLTKDEAVPSLAYQPPQGGEFSLQTVEGTIHLSDFASKTVLLFFGYTLCPDVCPTNMAAMRQVLNALNDSQQQQVVGLFVSVDPQRDDVAKLASYAGYFHPSIIGATADKAEIDRMVQAYGAFYEFTESESALGYLVNHSADTIVIDPKGRISGRLPHNANLSLAKSEVEKAMLAP